MRAPRGRRASSERLLARLGVLRCGTCGSRMVVGFRSVPRTGERYDFYRCPPVGDCPRRVTISARVAETAVIEAVRELLHGVEGRAGMGDAVEGAEGDLVAAEAALEAAVEAFSALDDVPAAKARLVALRDARDAARERLAELQDAAGPAITVTVDDWDMLTIEEQRSLIVAILDRVSVAPGRGSDRITVYPRGE